MRTSIQESIYNKLERLYGEQRALSVTSEVMELINSYKRKQIEPDKKWVDEKDIMMITYGDSIKEEGEVPLRTLREFLSDHLTNEINSVHILPFYPYTSDDGFSVMDYKSINEELGNWDDIQALSNQTDLMFDAVINHISSESNWFKEYLKGNEAYQDYFIEADPEADYSKVTRPRALPLLTKVETNNGEKHIWTTFSEDQIDLNYGSDRVLLEVLDILLTYVERGARFLRLDAIGFMWKKLGTTSIHLEETHLLVQVMREVLEEAAPGTIVITETNVPHKDNISYFGDGSNEAHLVYQFPLPPLTLHSFQTGDASELTKWAKSLEATTETTTYFNFLASHDGIGVRPVEGILSASEVQRMADKVQENGGYVSYKNNGDGTKSPYELNINYLDAISNNGESNEKKAKRFIAAQSVLLSLMGVPGIYVHSLLGSQNDQSGVDETGRYRSINREKLSRSTLEDELQKEGSLRNLVFNDLKKLIRTRKSNKAFHPNASQQVLEMDQRIFSVVRTNEQTGDRVVAITNVSDDTITLKREILDPYFDSTAFDLISKCKISSDMTLSPYEVLWVCTTSEVSE
ncbi:sugar phosphorylase [Alkalihalobacillus hwajinpoensis]|uniref:sugar phosphorylase n=1 Tax=Guptibacillus hwajinpoensis TaxID=208199 RepID=UPI0018834C1D|nr:sugar phosphorylase [Pseudalkalibacillus hwajinpoensis]MBF0705597.1 sugar phosphorylase [Pseudalkalibacillus hwajinpoensis]